MQRNVLSAALKANVARQALAGRQTVNEIAGPSEGPPHQVATWKREAPAGLPTLFERQRGRRRVAGGTAVDAVSGPIGRRPVHAAWLENKSELNPPAGEQLCFRSSDFSIMDVPMRLVSQHGVENGQQFPHTSDEGDFGHLTRRPQAGIKRL